MQHESSSGSSIKPEFSIRTVVCDHYLSKPAPGYDVIYSEFRGSDIKQVPILRVFGPTPEGYKACLHIHGVFPYFYIPCPSPNPEPQFMYQIAASLDKALNIALKQATSANQHVYKISLVKGLPFYGYHDKEHLYLKVFLYNPGLIKQAVELCSNGAILGQPFQPHESHLNFTLQFFIDFNLFGMSNIDLQTVKFRKTGISQNSTEILDSNDISLKPESMCYYEADCVASHIINRQRIGKGDGIENPGLEEVWNQEKERRKQLNISLASKSLTQGRPDSEETESHYKFQQMYLLNSSNLLDKPVLTDEELKPKEQVYYPAESSEGSQLINAVDVSVHLPEKSFGASFNESCKRDFDTTLVGDADDTIVDETVVLNNSLSLHYSQVLLDNEDLELLDLLQDMDEKPVDEDSIMGTPAGLDKDGDSDLDDAEYSQAFDDDTILLEPFESKDDGHETSLTWNDSFWDGANIPQLDGTCDDDHVKKVRKRKMRPFKLGLARPKSKKKEEIREEPDRSDTNVDSVESDEINASRETIDSISEIHIKGSVKHEPESILVDEECTNKPDNVTLTDLVNKMAISYENTIEPAAKYDLINKFEPMAGPSRSNLMKSELNHDISMNLSYDSTPEDNGIISFYDKSKLFDVTLSGANVTQDLFGSINDNDQEVDTSIVISKEKLSQEMNTNIEINEAHLEKKVKPHEQRYEYNYESNKIIVTPRIRPPKKNYVASTLDKYNIPKIRNPKPYYSDHKDVGDKVEIGHTILKLQSNLSRDQKPFEKVLQTTSLEEWRQLIFLQTNEMNEDTKIDNLQTLLAGNRKCILEPIRKPPSKFQIMKCLEETKTETVKQTEISKNIDELDNSQAIGLNEDEINSSISLEASDKDYTNVNNTSLQVTKQPDGSFLCFGNSESMKESSNDAPVVEVDFLTSMLVEVHASVRGELHPDPLIDPIRAVFITTTNDCPPNHFLEKIYTEIIVVDNSNPPKHLHRCVFNQNITYVNTEYDLLESVIERVKKHNPDIICGYEIEVSSWGYILERSQVLGLEIVKEMSRITEKNRQKKWRGDENDFEGRIIGRIMFNVWRLFRHELALSSYSFENCMYEVLKERVPKYSYAQLSEWWNDESRIRRWIPVEYYLTRLHGTVRMLDKLDIINRTSELARLFGLQWWEVLSRGSQFRVESLMLRATRPLNLIALSPTVRQRASMKAPECLPLIFEPESRFYSDPVIVLDFQSLYPSMMIAYNYCFSTCIGKVQNISGDSAYEFGAWRLRIPKRKLDTLVQSGLVHWSPVGAGFVKPSVRRGVLPALLRRILAARQAVKKGMKLQTDEGVKKAMHSRQLGLKLIANVTYGYTAANFSGRMPCVEVADSVVAKGRETLRRAIKLVEDTCKEAKVVYGDTDSMFVVVPGAGRAQAFALGQRIADAVTADNPAPVALKLEKVYQPCILQTKKRYVGFMYESPDQEKPVYEAKGIETVRRDGCPAGVKLLQRSLCELFSTGDVSAAKREARAALSRLATGATPPHELFFTREYHGANGYRPGAAAPPNEIAKRVLASDRRACPRPGQRVPWLVTAGPPGAPLVRLARSPAELKAAPAPAHIQYYAARVLLPPLHRCFSLLGVDVFKWWNELGYNREVQQRVTHGGIARYMCHERCAICGEKANVQTRGVGPTRGRIGKSGAVCVGCSEKGGLVAAVLTARVARAQTDLQHCQLICDSCCGHDQSQQCENTECPVLWRRAAATQKLKDECVVIAHLPSQPNQDLFF